MITVKDGNNGQYKTCIFNAMYKKILVMSIGILAFTFAGGIFSNYITASAASKEYKSMTDGSVINDSAKVLNDLINYKAAADEQELSDSLAKQENSYDSSKFPTDDNINKIISDKKRIDTGDDFLKDVISNNNRLDYYDMYIKLALKEGYIVTSYEDYLQNYKDTDKKVLILRHDIDATSDGTQKMIDIEKKNGVKATYYFRWATYDQKLINEIHDAGFEVGLHYETIATYCLNNKKNHVDQYDIDKCREILKQEIKQFKKQSGVDVKTIAGHGTPINRAIGVLNNVLLDDQNYSDYGIIGETYNKDILAHFISSYICDDDIMSKDGYTYKANPIESITGNAKVIEFLSHPHHWYYTLKERTAMYNKLQTRLSESSSNSGTN